MKFFFFVIAILSFCFASAQTLYPAPAGLRPSAEYQVFVNGKEAFVYQSPVPAAYCSFDMNAPVEVTIKASRDIKWVDVRPFAAGVKASFKDSTIRLQLKKPQQLSIELNGSIKMPLFLFANAPEKEKPARNNPNVIFFEAGKIHHPGIIPLKSNQTVYIEGGAVVVGVIKAKDAKNITIRGRGVLDGTYNNRLNDSLLKTLRDTAELRSMKGTYHRFLEFIDCENVAVEGITLHNSTSWQVVPINCTKVAINNVKIISDQASDDGIDVVRSKKVRINNCFIRTKDDNIVVKAHLDYPHEVAVDDVLAEDCVFWNALWGNALEIGFELNAAEIKNITFRNSDVIHVEAGAVISIHNAGTGHVKNVVFENIRIEDARQKLFDFAIFRSQYSVDGVKDPEERRRLYLNGAWDGVLMVPPAQRSYHAQFRGRISDVLLKNINVTDGLFPYSIFSGFDKEHSISNVTIENLTVAGRKIRRISEAKVYLENTNNIVIR
jgi:hypothetical protein